MWGIRRLRFATGVDDDLRPFHEAFRRRSRASAARCAPRRSCASRRTAAPVGGARGRDLRAADRVRPRGRDPAPADRRARAAAARGHRAARRAGARRPSPPPRRRELAAFDLAPSRALTLRRAAAEVAARPRRPAGRRPDAGLAPAARHPRHRAVDARVLALYGQGHHDRVPAGDLGYLKLVGRVTHGPPAGARGRRGRARLLRALRRVAGPGRGVPAARGGARACCPSVLRDRPRVEPLAGQELVRQRGVALGLRLREQPLSAHPARVGVPLVRVLLAERLARGPPGRRPAAWP